MGGRCKGSVCVCCIVVALWNDAGPWGPLQVKVEAETASKGQQQATSLGTRFGTTTCLGQQARYPCLDMVCSWRIWRRGDVPWSAAAQHPPVPLGPPLFGHVQNQDRPHWNTVVGYGLVCRRLVRSGLRYSQRLRWGHWLHWGLERLAADSSDGFCPRDLQHKLVSPASAQSKPYTPESADPN